MTDNKNAEELLGRWKVITKEMIESAVKGNWYCGLPCRGITVKIAYNSKGCVDVRQAYIGKTPIWCDDGYWDYGDYAWLDPNTDEYVCAIDEAKYFHEICDDKDETIAEEEEWNDRY